LLLILLQSVQNLSQVPQALAALGWPDEFKNTDYSPKNDDNSLSRPEKKPFFPFLSLDRGKSGRLLQFRAPS